MIRLDNVSYAYEESAADAVSGVSLEIKEGSFAAILGRNGSGKSTLAKLINGIYLPRKGTVTVDGMDTRNTETTWEIRKKVGIIFQNPDNQIVATTVADDVAFGMENLGVPPEEMPARIREALLSTGMAEFAEKAPHLLSGGQKQRVAIAGILAMRPDTIICDEATAMLDPAGRREVFDVISGLNREKRMTVIWITHFMEEAAHADEVYVMDGGRVRIHGTPREVFSNTDELASCRLTLPFAADVSDALRQKGIDIPLCLDVDELVKEVAERCC